jgi:hypothetical protein
MVAISFFTMFLSAGEAVPGEILQTGEAVPGGLIIRREAFQFLEPVEDDP